MNNDRKKLIAHRHKQFPKMSNPKLSDSLKNISWQEKISTHQEGLSYVLKKSLWTDCKFLVGKTTEKKTFKAHKLILSMNSPVFEAELITHTDLKSEVIEVDDIEPDIFQDVLTYIYGGSISWRNASHVFQVYYAAEKYLISRLKTSCVRKCEDYLSNDLHVFEIYENTVFFNLKTLKDMSFHVIISNLQKVFDSEKNYRMKESTWLSILSSEQINISEVDLFKCLISWGEVERSNRNLKEGSQVDLRSVILFALPKIRFLTFTLEEFGKGPAVSGVLTNDEIASIFIKLVEPSRSIDIPKSLCTNTNKRTMSRRNCSYCSCSVTGVFCIRCRR